MAVNPARLPEAAPGRAHSCSTCAFTNLCRSDGIDEDVVARVEALLVDETSQYSEGQHIFREGDPFDSIAAVRGGTVKTYVLDREGREQVLGFHLPGEVVGLNAIHTQTFPCNAVALEPVVLCRFSFRRMSELAALIPDLQSRLFRLLSEDIGKAALLSGDFSADERMAAFLLSLSRRYARRGFSATRFNLTMPRTDIANYLRLAPETVSRVLKRFQDDGLLRVERREVELLDRGRIEVLAQAILRS